MKNEKLLIAGPCSLESEAHARHTIRNAQALGIDTVRMNLWKPRTSPGFEGVGKKGLPWLQAAAEQDMIPALEVLLPQQAELVMKKVLLASPHATLLLWIGSRNQNHLLQKDIGRAIAGEQRVKLMVKNQPWRDLDHWRGIVNHVRAGGASTEQLMLCHRGFAPWDKARSATRNIADLEMALALQAELGIPLIMDPSHIGGRADIVKGLIREYQQTEGVDGQIIEVHPDPTIALTDPKQQLTWDELQATLEMKEKTL